jgi:hypothetical protein
VISDSSSGLDTKAVPHGKRPAEIPKHPRMKFLFSIFSIVLVCFWTAVVPTNAQVNVTQFHNHDSRDGLYIDSAFTRPQQPI